MSKKFYIVQVHSGCEEYVEKMVHQKISLDDSLTEQFGSILIPKQKVVELKKGQKTTVEKKFYPGYIVIEMVMNEYNWSMVKSISKVVSFMGGTSGKPAPLSKIELDKIRSSVVESDVHPKHKVSFEIGEEVRIIDGPFIDYTGVLDSVNEEDASVQMLVTILGRETALRLGFAQITKV